MKADKSLDCVGLFCPMPIIQLKGAIDTIEAGKVIEILADDPAFEKDLRAWCNVTGMELLSVEKDSDGTVKGYVRKK